MKVNKNEKLPIKSENLIDLMNSIESESESLSYSVTLPNTNQIGEITEYCFKNNISNIDYSLTEIDENEYSLSLYFGKYGWCDSEYGLFYLISEFENGKHYVRLKDLINEH